MKKINVLGTEYSIYELAENEDPLLKNCDGYCDKTTKKIVLLQFDKNNCEIEDIEWYRKKVCVMRLFMRFCLRAVLLKM